MNKVLNVYIIDDDADDKELLIEAISEGVPDIQFYTAGNGQEAMEKLNNKLVPIPALIFLDLNMPKLNGKQTLLQLKKNSQTANIPVVVYSTSSYDTDIADVKALGAEHYWVKDTDFNNLQKKLKALFAAIRG